MIDQVRDLETRLEEAEKNLLFVPSDQIEKAKAEINDIRDKIVILKSIFGDANS